MVKGGILLASGLSMMALSGVGFGVFWTTLVHLDTLPVELFGLTNVVAGMLGIGGASATAVGGYIMSTGDDVCDRFCCGGTSSGRTSNTSHIAYASNMSLSISMM
jgi:hypothetical protein